MRGITILSFRKNVRLRAWMPCLAGLQLISCRILVYRLAVVLFYLR
jgi:hypothetical protein